ncbi:MAG: transferrin-binding protein-like solute binding protein, partial [Rhodobacter sp.]|nr:transferrin-binding protein-like solute binding protein [Rhodobacter sp.]
LPALTVAGALALAGCGGGSDSMGDMDMGDKENGKENGGEAELSLLSLPGGGSYRTEHYATGNIEAGKHISVGSGIRVNCPEAAGDAGCDYRITEDGIYAAGNAEAVAPTVAVAAGADGDSSDDTHPLSRENLLAAIVQDGDADGQLYGADVDDDIAGGVTFNRADGYSTRLYLDHIGADANPDTNRIYFGHWAEWKRGDGSFEGKATREPVYGGSMPYGKLPLSTAGGQAYASGGLAELYYKSGDGDWEVANGEVELTAHFDNRLIHGEIYVADDVTGVPDIDLGSASITASGFSGEAEFATGKTRTGSWEGQFYGPSEAATGTGDTVPGTQPDPTHAAGKFSVARDADGPTNPKLTVQGAFGVGAGT